jgi:endonuclease YncB( thermonuclease family)
MWFRYVSPERSALSQDREYVDWFRKKVVFELDRKLTGKSVTVQFEIEPPSGRPYGMVLLGEENINVWLVLHGWSYSLLAAEKTPYDETFAEAEQIARREKAGLWGRGG